MLYLEDYLEMIEHLPAELRDRFTEMREQDLSLGIATMCIGIGQGIATVVERV